MNRQEYFQLMEAATTPLFRKKNKKGKKHKAHEKKETAAKEKMEEQEEKFGGKEVEESDGRLVIYNGFVIRLREGAAQRLRGLAAQAGGMVNAEKPVASAVNKARKLRRIANPDTINKNKGLGWAGNRAQNYADAKRPRRASLVDLSGINPS